MNLRLVALTAVVALSGLFLTGCQTDNLMPESPYFGIGHRNKLYVPPEIQ